MKEIQEKARASLTSVSAFLAFAVAVLVGFAFWGDFNQFVRSIASAPTFWSILGFASLGILLPYTAFWSERYITAAAVEGGVRLYRYPLMVLSSLASLLLFLFSPLLWPSWYSELEKAFPLSGSLMVVLSVFFLLSSLEFYDFASGWRGGKELHFHLASLASNSYVFGVSLILVGVSLILCLLNFFVGRLLASTALVVLIVVTEVERQLWDLQP